jgi:acyl-CoA reductase-like NAD-dependent aldehyde dehydrogenase
VRIADGSEATVEAAVDAAEHAFARWRNFKPAN